MEMKFKILEESKVVNGHFVHRIMATKDFGSITKGTIGGFVESYDNLSQHDSCWVYDDAVIYGNTLVCNHAVLKDEAIAGSEYYTVLIKDMVILSGDAILNAREELILCGAAHIGAGGLITNTTDYCVWTSSDDRTITFFRTDENDAINVYTKDPDSQFGDYNYPLEVFEKSPLNNDILEKIIEVVKLYMRKDDIL